MSSLKIVLLCIHVFYGFCISHHQDKRPLVSRQGKYPGRKIDHPYEVRDRHFSCESCMLSYDCDHCHTVFGCRKCERRLNIDCSDCIKRHSCHACRLMGCACDEPSDVEVAEVDCSKCIQKHSCFYCERKKNCKCGRRRRSPRGPTARSIKGHKSLIPELQQLLLMLGLDTRTGNALEGDEEDLVSILKDLLGNEWGRGDGTLNESGIDEKTGNDRVYRRPGRYEGSGYEGGQERRQAGYEETETERDQRRRPGRYDGRGKWGAKRRSVGNKKTENEWGHKRRPGRYERTGKWGPKRRPGYEKARDTLLTEDWRRKKTSGEYEETGDKREAKRRPGQYEGTGKWPKRRPGYEKARDTLLIEDWRSKKKSGEHEETEDEWGPKVIPGYEEINYDPWTHGRICKRCLMIKSCDYCKEHFNCPCTKDNGTVCVDCLKHELDAIAMLTARHP